MPIVLKWKELVLLGCEEATGVWYIYKDGEWKELGLKNHSHPTLDDINFTGTISVGGEEGLTGSKVLDGKQLTFTNGILTGYEVV